MQLSILTFEFKKYKSEEVKYFCERNGRVIAHHHAIPTLIWSNLGNVVPGVVQNKMKISRPPH